MHRNHTLDQIYKALENFIKHNADGGAFHISVVLDKSVEAAQMSEATWVALNDANQALCTAFRAGEDWIPYSFEVVAVALNAYVEISSAPLLSPQLPNED